MMSVHRTCPAQHHSAELHRTARHPRPSRAPVYRGGWRREVMERTVASAETLSGDLWAAACRSGVRPAADAGPAVRTAASTDTAHPGPPR